jgi:uncharacterized Zn finger protein (UPF0148 family)
MCCTDCGGPLACYEGERYCPDCTRYEVEELARQADEEARAIRQAPAAGLEEGPPDDALPF